MSSVIVTIILYEMITNKSTGLLDLLDDTTSAAYRWLIDGWNAKRQSAEYQAQYDERASSVAGGFQNIFDQLMDVFSGGALDRLNKEKTGN